MINDSDKLLFMAHVYLFSVYFIRYSIRAIFNKTCTNKNFLFSSSNTRVYKNDSNPIYFVPLIPHGVHTYS